MRLDNLKATAPDGSNVPLEHPMQGQWRSTFDVHLTQPGTYKIGSASQTMNASRMSWCAAASDYAGKRNIDTDPPAAGFLTSGAGGQMLQNNVLVATWSH